MLKGDILLGSITDVHEQVYDKKGAMGCGFCVVTEKTKKDPKVRQNRTTPHTSARF